MLAALVEPDLVQDIVFGATLVIAGVSIIGDAVRKALPGVITALVAAIATYGTFYL